VTTADFLALADWRRAIAALYAEVRALAQTDPRAAHAYWRATRERLYRDHPQSPLPLAARESFAALHFPYDPALHFIVAVEPDDEAVASPAVAIPTSGSDAMSFRRIGRVAVPFPAGTRRLALHWLEDYAGGLFLSFRDATNGHETYGGGRYLLDAAKGADLGGDPAGGTLVLDFNFAYQPSCAFDPRWVCPLVAPENRLDLPVRAGECIAGK
jgi:uncharacterized protein (DUF1684 family)